MTEPSIVTSEEAQGFLAECERLGPSPSLEQWDLDVAYTVATAPERHETGTRAAVVKALRTHAHWLRHEHWHAAARTTDDYADAIENGAPYA